MTILFWQMFEMNGIKIREYILENPVINISDNLGMKSYFIELAYGIVSLILIVVLFIVWYLRGLGSTLLKFGLAMILIGIAGQAVANINSFPLDSLFSVLGLTIITYTELTGRCRIYRFRFC